MKLYKEEILKSFKNNGLRIDRLISLSKSGYRSKYPYNTVIFNANIFILHENHSVKIWYGDLDISLEGDILKKISKEIGYDLYVLHEMDGRFENENQEHPDEVAIWNTNMETPIITEEYIQRKKEEEIENERIDRIQTFTKGRADIFKNRTYPIYTDLNKIDDFFIERIKVPYDLIEKEYEKIKNDKKRLQLKEQEFYYKEHGYLSAYVLDEFLYDYLKVDKKTHNLNPSAFWLSPKTNHKLRHIDFESEKLFDENFKYTDFGRHVTCNYCVPSISWLNHDEINIKSYEDDYIYIRKNYARENF